MPTILDEIVTKKWQEIDAAKASIPEVELLRRCQALAGVRDFEGRLRLSEEPPHPGPLPRSGGEGVNPVGAKNRIRIIAEVKKASPSAGIIRADFDPVTIARTYEAHGADCLSVLTDKTFFQGDLAYLSAIHEAVVLPVLRKEFILDRYQLLEARAAGADAVLLIAEILPGGELKKLYDAARAIGLHILVELHDADQLQRVIDCGATLIGINNRDLRTFHTSLDHTLTLRPKVPSHCCVVSESGIKSHGDLLKLEAAGVKAVLVGESLMRSPDIGAALDQLRGVNQPERHSTKLMSRAITVGVFLQLLD